MGEIIKRLDDGAVLYKFSEDILSGVRSFAHLVKECEGQQETIICNMSCIFFAGSYLESWLNETIAFFAGSSEDSETRPSLEFWKALDRSQKTMSIKEKWDLISSIDGGSVWDNSVEPFQSYEIIVSLRNELVHFKGKFDDGENPPIKKIKTLLQRFNGQQSEALDALKVSSWVHELLTANQLGSWIAEVLMEFDRDMKHLLTGTPITQDEKNCNLFKRMFY